MPTHVPLVSPTILRAPKPSDGSAMWSLARRTGLDLNAPYAYVLWSHHHHRTTVVADHGGIVVGFALGYSIPPDHQDLFIWQIAVAEEVRGLGVGGLMLDTLLRRLRPAALEATVTPTNDASAAMFRSLARRHRGNLHVSPCFGPDLFPAPHDHEDLYRIVLPADWSAEPDTT